MNIAVTATGPSLSDHVEARFGRCPYFLIVDTDSLEFEAIENPNVAAGGGAGVQSAQLMADKSVEAVLTGNCGPNAYNVFGAAGIQVIVGVSGVVRDAIEQFKAGAFTSTSGPNVASHFGMAAGAPGDNPGMRGSSMGRGVGGGGGRGGGRGMGGGGRGMGRGMGMGDGMAGAPSATPYAGAPVLPQQPGGWVAPTLVAVVDAEKCVLCGVCVDACPVGAIAVNDVVEVDRQKCTGCGLCVTQCPHDAVSLHAAA